MGSEMCIRDRAVTETIISLIAEVNITLCPLFYPLNVTFTFAINRLVIVILPYMLSKRKDSRNGSAGLYKAHIGHFQETDGQFATFFP